MGGRRAHRIQIREFRVIGVLESARSILQAIGETVVIHVRNFGTEDHGVTRLDTQPDSHWSR